MHNDMHGHVNAKSMHRAVQIFKGQNFVVTYITSLAFAEIVSY